jgi:ankyrin repeat protein
VPTRKHQWESRLKRWNFSKKLTPKDWRAIDDLMKKRLQQQGKSSVVLWNDLVVDRVKLSKEIRRNRAKSKDFAKGTQFLESCLETRTDIENYPGTVHKLPYGVVVRSPSPEPNMRVISEQPTVDDLVQLKSSENPAVSFISETSWDRSPPMIEILPFIQFRDHLQITISYFPKYMLNLDLASTGSLIEKHLRIQKASQDLTKGDISSFDIAMTALRLISNNHMSELQTPEFLRAFTTNMPMSLVQSIISLRTPMVQALTTKFLEVAVMYWWPDVLRLLVDCGIDQTLLTGLRGGRLLQLAVSDKSFHSANCYGSDAARSEVVQYLLSKGAEVNPALPLASPLYSMSPLLYALKKRYLNEAKAFLSAGASMPLINSTWQRIPSMFEAAIRYGDAEIMALCIHSGGNVDELYIDHDPALIWAFCQNEEVFEILYEASSVLESGFSVLNILLASRNGLMSLNSYLKHHEKQDYRETQPYVREALYRSIQNSLFPEQIKMRLAAELYLQMEEAKLMTLTRTTSLVELAIQQSEIQVIKVLLAGGLDIETVISQWCETVTERHDHDAVLRLLVNQGIDMSYWGHKLLSKSAQLLNFEDCHYLIERGATFYGHGNDGLGAMKGLLLKEIPGGIIASTAQRLPMLDILINAGAKVNHSSESLGSSPLRLAASLGNLAIFDFLVSKGAYITPRSDHSACLQQKNVSCDTVYTECFHDWAMNTITFGYEQERILVRLLDMNIPVKPDCPAVTQGPSVLVNLIKLTGSTELVGRFIDAGADVTEYTYQRYNGFGSLNPLQAAATEGDIDMIRYLLYRGGDINTPAGQSFGRTVLQAACQHPDLNLIQFLLDEKADVNAKPGQRMGVTALQGAAIAGDVEIAKILIAAGANINAAGAEQEGRMALDGAAEHGRLDMVQFLLNSGARSGYGGKTGYDGAIALAENPWSPHDAVADLLRSHARNVRDNLALRGMVDWSLGVDSTSDQYVADIGPRDGSVSMTGSILNRRQYPVFPTPFR